MRNITGTYSNSRQHWVGDGFPVRTLLSHERAGDAASPFLLLDHAGPHSFGPKNGAPRGVGAHPHKGFETVTIVYDGEVEHRDSTGAGGIIGPGDVQWMTAGRGIMHQEHHSKDFTRKGGAFEMVQLWVNLPARHKNAPAGYQNITREIIPKVTVGDSTVRVIAGAFGKTKGPTRTFTPINLWDARIKARTSLSLPVPESHNTTLVVLRGGIELGNRSYEGPQSIVMEPGKGAIEITAREDSLVLILSGAPINEPVVQYGPFVMNSEAEIRRAMADFNAGRFGRVTG